MTSLRHWVQNPRSNGSSKYNTYADKE